jgi:orotidine-5'-phosphate decarboxylase
MTLSELKQLIASERNYLCVGLDTDLSKLPAHLGQSPESLLDFNQQIIAGTLEFCVAYKINTAFYEAMGKMGWELLEKTRNLIPSTHFVIADAKRGDIGNTSSMYARAFFEQMNFDAITVSPYMGFDSVQPFLAYSEKTTIVLALTSNSGSSDFQKLELRKGGSVYEEVLSKVAQWGENLMFVVGATQADYFEKVRQIVPEGFLLVPGVGTQGGDLASVCRYGRGKMLINSSREILYASTGEDFAQKAALKAQMLQENIRLHYGL